MEPYRSRIDRRAAVCISAGAAVVCDVACGAGVVPFLHEWSAFVWDCGNRAYGGKLLPLLQLHAIERGRCWRMREQCVQVGARRWGGHAGGGEAQQSG
jgi:hypothetical protein